MSMQLRFNSPVIERVVRANGKMSSAPLVDRAEGKFVVTASLEGARWHLQLLALFSGCDPSQSVRFDHTDLLETLARINPEINPRLSIIGGGVARFSPGTPVPTIGLEGTSRVYGNISRLFLDVFTLTAKPEAVKLVSTAAQEFYVPGIGILMGPSDTMSPYGGSFYTELYGFTRPTRQSR